MREEINQAIKRVLDSGQFILGEEVKAFEKEFAQFCDTDYAVGVANCTDAIYIALKSLNIGAGDEVITVSHTSSATISAIKLAEATPVFIDIDDTFLMNPELIAEAITSRTKAILPVHLYGRLCDMKEIKAIADSYGLWVIEDCAQSVGAGNLCGDIGCYSFYPTKNLGGIGDGGCIVTNNRTLADKARRLREYGYGERFVSNFLGINSRLDEIQAAVLRVKLKYLPAENLRRWGLAMSYVNGLWGSEIYLPSSVGVFHQFVIRVNPIVRNELVKKFNFQIHYPVPCHLQPAYKRYTLLPVTTRICSEIVSLPMRATIEEAKKICENIKGVL